MKEAKTPRVAAIQMCSSSHLKENLMTAKKFIEQAAHHNTPLIVLPEMFAIMGLTPNDMLAAKEKYHDGIIQDFLAEQASKNNIWIVGGTIPIAEKGNPDKVRAACLVYDAQGKVVARYDKIHLFDVTLSATESYKESDNTEPGDTIVVVDTPVGKLGLGVCYDVRFPDMFQHLFDEGAEIIALPSAFTAKTGEAHWEILLRCRAIDHFSYVIGAAQGGTHAGGRKTFGNSMIVSPWGEIIAQKEGVEPGIIYADVDLEKVYAARKAIPH
jgi:nitrilase